MVHVCEIGKSQGRGVRGDIGQDYCPSHSGYSMCCILVTQVMSRHVPLGLHQDIGPTIGPYETSKSPSLHRMHQSGSPVLLAAHGPPRGLLGPITFVHAYSARHAFNDGLIGMC